MNHQAIDERSLAMARAIAEKIDRDPRRAGLDRAREVCARWGEIAPAAAVEEWAGILAGSWEEVRPVLLDPSEEGRRLRQSHPFCGVLSPRERWAIYREFRGYEQAAT